ncbi:hypothetical protein PHSY_007266 [Pseudozyma hubeiensis SY62]|uniref:Uncharacterized protein n=1 Tax=Pseudozyma hubeiensis (strain SY62) TaxID=1305764 RepID=R9PE61_PSEHS|nr:hypothetical protein PHSY_007266 [Pseudozyma hubeiensis SY62]GAC99663.1 hypothetical protein PHSY_007266 [Pseudozyma hubeiensis SY62]
MSLHMAAQNDAGPSSGSRCTETGVRRCKTVSHASSSDSRPRPPNASAVANSLTLKGLALPIDLYDQTFGFPESRTALREPALSPSRRGETLRAYSRQRRVFPDGEERPPTSPEQSTSTLPPLSPVSRSSRRLHSARNLTYTSAPANAIGSSLLFAPSGQATEATEGEFKPARPRIDTPADEPPSSLSSTPSLTSPTSTLSRSTSLRSAASDRSNLMGGTRYLSLNGSSDLCSTKGDAAASNWPRRARRWSNTLSHTMSFSALNQTIQSTTSPYLKAGLQELRSIFDVDTLGAAVDDQDDTDLEGASPTDRRALAFGERDPLGLFGSGDAASAAAFSRSQAVFESPEAMSPNLSRQSSSEDREPLPQDATGRHSIGFRSQRYPPPVTHRRVQSWRKHRSLSISMDPSPSLLAPAPSKGSACDPHRGSSESFYSTRTASARSLSIRTPLLAVGLAALSIVIVGVCAFETSLHPDAASLPLTTFMLAQSVFALGGISGLALQRRWLIDLASRLIRAHVLCQVLIALAALHSLSRTAFHHTRSQRQTFTETAAAGVLTSPRFFASSPHAADPHTSSVGSFGDQATYMCVFLVQAALPLAGALWAQYALATALSRISRSLPLAGGAAKQRHEHSQQGAPVAKPVKAASHDESRHARMRFNSENSTLTESSSQTAVGGAAQRSEGWLGFVITRLDVDKDVKASPKFELDAAELTTRLQELATAEVLADS